MKILLFLVLSLLFVGIFGSELEKRQKRAQEIIHAKKQHLEDLSQRHLEGVKRKEQATALDNNPELHDDKKNEHSVAMEAKKKDVSKSNHHQQHRNPINNHHTGGHHGKLMDDASHKRGGHSHNNKRNNHHSEKKVLGDKTQHRESVKDLFHHSVKRVERWLDGQGMGGKVNKRSRVYKSVNNAVGKIQRVMDRHKRNSHKKKMGHVEKRMDNTMALRKKGSLLKHHADLIMKDNLVKRFENDPRLARNENNMLKRVHKPNKPVKHHEDRKDENGLSHH